MQHMTPAIGGPAASVRILVAALLVAACNACGGNGGNGGSASSPAPQPVPGPPGGSKVDVLTYHNDSARSGQNLQETVLTPANVDAAHFGKLGFYPVDGKVDAQPLLLAGLAINGAAHDVLYVATEHGSVYAFDANTGAVLWQVSLLGAGETPSDARGCNQVVPEIGITATPAIDRAAATIYFIAMSKDGAGHYIQRLHALDVASGAERAGSPKLIEASVPGSGVEGDGTNLRFDAKVHKERLGLLLDHGVVYSAWSSHCDIGAYSGWVLGYDARSLTQTAAYALEPNGVGAGLWSADAAIAADGAGNLYLLAGNGDFETALDAGGFPGGRDYGNAFLKLSTAGGRIAVADYFTMSNALAESNADQDLGSGGALVLPDFADATGRTRHLAVGAGKDRHLYVVDREAMGGFHADGNRIYQDLAGALGGPELGMPAYYKGSVYFAAANDHLRAFPIAAAKLASAAGSQSPDSFPYPGATPSVSANGSDGGIVWAVENGDTAVLHAYDAANLAHEIYNSSQAAGGRDAVGAGNKFMTPTIANGKVFVGTTNGVAVFGLLR